MHLLLSPVFRLVGIALALLATPLAAQPSASPLSDTLSVDEALGPKWVRSAASGVGLDGLPVRSVREAAALLPRVRGDFHTGRLVVGAHPGIPNPRADWYPYAERVGQEPVFLVDGVRVADRYEIPFESVASVEVLSGFVPARFGESAAGLILVETRKGGAEYGAEFEAGISEGLDSYGHTRAAFSVGGPLSSRGRFALSGSWRSLADAALYGVETPRLSDADFEALQQNPQALRLVNDGGDQQFIPLPSDLVTDAGISLDALATQLGDAIPAGFQIAENGPVLDAPQTYTADRFEQRRGIDDPLRDLRLGFAAGHALGRTQRWRWPPA